MSLSSYSGEHASKPIVGSVHDPVVVFGVHGAEGQSFWKCFARGNRLASSLEAWEYAALSPRTVNGEHLHTRTDEIYFILSGEGEMSLNGEPSPVRAGDAILTPLGARHGLSNLSDQRLEWLTLEVVAPETEALLASLEPTGAPAMPSERERQPTIVSLRDGKPFDPKPFLSERWGLIQIVRLEPHQQRALDAGKLEHVAYILRGEGTAHTTSELIEFLPGTALTLPRGTSATIAAGEEPVEFFHLSLETAF